MTARGTATNKLTNIIQMLQMARKTGLLQVNRDGVNNTIEQGILSFQDGQIVDASVGSFTGSEAWRLLQGWQSCYFIFQASAYKGDGLSLSTNMSPTATNSSLGYPVGATPLPPTSRGGDAPQRIREANDILPYFDRLGLTRLHRQLFLLIDGYRTVPDLIRLTGHRTDEVYTLLSDLARVGLIRW